MKKLKRRNKKAFLEIKDFSSCLKTGSDKPDNENFFSIKSHHDAGIRMVATAILIKGKNPTFNVRANAVCIRTIIKKASPLQKEILKGKKIRRAISN
jgi:hypothetical protein